ncbi:MAG: DUF45 domain-containing protein [Clostridia bacterium]|nr:DUF45 domain-containing protein [Clostridia bacterium]
MNLFFNRKNLISYTVDTAFDNNLSISVQNGEVVVSAPWYLSKKQIQTVVSEKTNWILEKLKEYDERKKLGYENIILFGKSYITKITFKHIQTPEVTLNSNSIDILLPTSYKNKNINNVMEFICNKLYVEVANQELEAILEKARLTLKLAPENIEIKYMKNILATCENGQNITINPELFKYKREIIEYIVIHEFCHLKYKTHSKSFYTMLKKYVPNYETLSNEIHGAQY